METIKNGQLKGIKYVVDKDGNITSAMIVKFLDGTFFILLPNTNKSTFIKNFVDEFNLGIANANTFFNYIDFRNNVAIKFNICLEDCESYVEPVIVGLDEDIAKDILDISSVMNYNCNIVNFGILPNMNTLKISNNMPKEIQTNYQVIKTNKDESELDTNFDGVSISSLLNKEEVSLNDNIIISLSNSWANEGWYGPQSYGGYNQLDGTCICNKGKDSYNFTFSNIKDFIQNGNYSFDENTIISLEGDNSTGFNILLPLKKRDMLIGIKNSSISSGLVQDVETLFNLNYKTHENYLKEFPNGLLKLETIENIYKYFQEYEEYIHNRQKTINENARTMYGSKAKVLKISVTNIDEDLPFC